MNRLLLTIFFAGAALLASAQTEAEFSEMEHNLGTLVWHNGAQATFTVRNTGQEDLVITSVEPDCGCTLVSWTQGRIAPGKSGSISARYDAEQLGHFSKGFAVYLNQDEEPVYLTVSGKVVDAQLAVAEAKNFEHHFGAVDISSDELDFDDVRADDEPFRTIEIVNRSAEVVTPSLMHLPSYLTASYAPDLLYPGATGKILVTLNPRNLPDYGLTKVGVYLSTKQGEAISRDREITVSATLLPRLEDIETEDGGAPRIAMDKTSLALGSLGGKSRSEQIVLSNTGDAPLEIIAMQGYNAGISYSLGSQTIKPGGRTKLKVKVSPAVFKFKGRHALLLITNDTTQPKVVVPIEVSK